MLQMKWIYSQRVTYLSVEEIFIPDNIFNLENLVTLLFKKNIEDLRYYNSKVNKNS